MGCASPHLSRPLSGIQHYSLPSHWHFSCLPISRLLLGFLGQIIHFHVGIPQSIVLGPPLLSSFILFSRWSHQCPHLSCHPSANDLYLIYWSIFILLWMPHSWITLPTWQLALNSACPKLNSSSFSRPGLCHCIPISVSPNPTVAQARNLGVACDSIHFLIPQIHPIWKSCWLCSQSLSWIRRLPTTSCPHLCHLSLLLKWNIIGVLLPSKSFSGQPEYSFLKIQFLPFHSSS